MCTYHEVIYKIVQQNINILNAEFDVVLHYKYASTYNW